MVKTGRLSPRLVAATQASDRTSRGRSEAAGLPATGPGSLVWHASGGVLVDVLLDGFSAARLDELEAAGAVVTATADGNPRVTVAIDPALLDDLAVLPGVRSIMEVLAPKSNATCPTGITDEGDAQLAANTARTTFGVNGLGVKVGVISDSYNALGGAPADITGGELPGGANTCGFNSGVQVVQDIVGGTDEGRAMAQIVHDLAPGASLAFATANGGEVAFANNIRALQAAGSKVIVDDVGYFAEPMYQDGDIAKAVRDVTALGSTYFSAAGNANVIVGPNNVGSYEAPSYRPVGCPAAVAARFDTSCHDFDPSAGTDNTDTVTVAAGGRLQISFGWNEPSYGTATDYDAYLLNSAGAILDASEYENTGPTGISRTFEFLDHTNNTGSTQTYHIVFGRYLGGSPRFKFIMQTASGLSGVQFATSSLGDVVGPTVYGHSAVVGMGTIGAVRYNTMSQPETFSSRGPATYCWGPVTGTTSPAPAVPCYTKTVDVLATDGSQNSFFGTFAGPGYRFFGTSAAAPHAAAVAALQLQARPCRTPAQVLAAQRAGATAVAGFGVDAAGSGIVNAVGAINNLANCLPATHFQVVAPANATIGQPTTFTVTALDVNDAKVTNYTGTVHFTSSDGAAGLPADGTLTLGVGTFTATFNTLGTRSITATDTVTASINGSASVLVTNKMGYHPITPVRILETRAALGALQYSTPWGHAVDRSVQVLGNGVPSGAKAVVLNVTAVEASLPSDLRIYPAGTPRPNVSNLNFNAGQTIANSVIVQVGTGGNIQIYNNSGTVHVLADVVGWIDDGTANGDRFVSMTPVRILETRAALGALQYNTRWGQGTDRTVHVTGNGVPTNATAVALNVTAVDPSLPSDLRVYPTGTSRPNTSNLNMAAHQTIPNLVIARVGTNGDIQIYNNSGTVDVLADVVGYFQPAASGGDGYHPMSPVRILESRASVGPLQYNTPWGPAMTRTVHVVGGTVPANAKAVVLNVTAVNPSLPSDLRIFPTGQSMPNASSLNFAAGQTVANLVIARVITNGNIEIYNNSGTVDVIADVVGYYT